MRTMLTTIAPVLRLTRVTSGFAAIGNVWFVVLWSRLNAEEGWNSSLRDEPLWLLLLGGAAAALGLYAFGACLNDLVDLRRDRMLRPERPLPAGRVSPAIATALVAGTLMAAVLGATVFGTAAVVLTLTLAVAVLAYTLAARFVPGVGLVVLGLVYAGHMMVPNVGMRFLWPVWVVMTHALAVAAISHVVARKVPHISRRAAVACVVGWAFWSGVLLWAGLERNDGDLWPEWVNPRGVAWVGGVVAAFGVFLWRQRGRPGSPAKRGERIVRYGTLWLPLYGAAWLIADDAPGVWSGAGLLLGIAGVSLFGMTILREMYGLAEQPIGYRR